MISYQEVDEIFEKLDADYSAAEAHGIAVGMLCVELRADIDNWLQPLLIDKTTLDEEDWTVLSDLYQETQLLLSGDEHDFSFDLLLPDDDEPLFEQIEALRDWCQGFLLGIGYSQSSANWPTEVREVILDVIEFTKLESQSMDEEEANALMEVHEYIRIGVLTVRDYFLVNDDTQQH